MNYLNLLNNKFLTLLIVTLFFTSCDKDDEPNAGNIQLSFNTQTLPSGEVSSEGGILSLKVDWAYTRWSINSDSVTEGEAFIDQISPAQAGVENKDLNTTSVSIKFAKNDSHTINKQVLTLKSLSGGPTHYLEVTQAAKPIEVYEINIDPETIYQTISGFGGAAIWHSLPLSTSHIQTLLGTGDDELGLSIVRVRIAPEKTSWSSDVSMLQEMETYGVKILASPWSPPGEWKYGTQADPLVNGYLMEEHYADYANYLNDYVTYMADQNIVIDVVSVQNEPDWPASYESCEWEPEHLLNFVKNHGSIIENAKLLASESLRFSEAFTDPILNDPIAVENIDIVGGHLYGNRIPSKYTLAEEKEKEIWMTEYLLNSGDGNESVTPEVWATFSEGVVWDESLEMLGLMHESMISNWNAYIWWYMKRYYSLIGDGSGGTAQGEVLKRGFAFSHYSKFIRPGYVRVESSTTNTSGLKITSYKGDNKLVTVILNPGTSSFSAVNLSAPQAMSSAKIYTTSEFENRTEQSLTPDDNSVMVNIPPKSVATIVLTF